MASSLSGCRPRRMKSLATLGERAGGQVSPPINEVNGEYRQQRILLQSRRFPRTSGCRWLAMSALTQPRSQRRSTADCGFVAIFRPNVTCAWLRFLTCNPLKRLKGLKNSVLSLTALALPEIPRFLLKGLSYFALRRITKFIDGHPQIVLGVMGICRMCIVNKKALLKGYSRTKNFALVPRCAVCAR